MTDWQAYLDGSLSEQDKAAADARLAADAAARAELDGLKEFTSKLRDSALAEAVPVDRLQAGMRSALRPTGVFGTNVRPGVAAAMAACLVLVALAVNFAAVLKNPIPVGNGTSSGGYPGPIAIDLRKSAFVGALDGSDPKTAAAWATKTVHYNVPPVDLQSVGATMTKTECGGCWIAYHFDYEGSDYTLYGRRETGGLAKATTLQCGSDVALYLVQDGVAWYAKNGMTYVLKGGDSAGRESLAKIASDQTQLAAF